MAITKEKQKEQEVVEYPHLVHHMIRPLNRDGFDAPDGSRSIETADKELSGWIEQGYKIAYAGITQSDNLKVEWAYLLVKPDALA